MRTRAYRPEAPNCLEERSLLSGVAGPPVEPVVLSGQVFNNVISQIRVSFKIFTRTHDMSQLRSQIEQVVVLAPFGRADGLRVSISSSLKKMRQEIYAGVPHAIFSARNDVIAVTQANVAARIQNGEIIVVDD